MIGSRVFRSLPAGRSGFRRRPGNQETETLEIRNLLSAEFGLTAASAAAACHAADSGHDADHHALQHAEAEHDSESAECEEYHSHQELFLVDSSGNELYAVPEAVAEARTIGGGTNPGGIPPFDYSETFRLHSNPGAAHTIYLDFDGHTTAGTTWNSVYNGGAAFTTPAFSPDGAAGFSNTELARIQRIWQRVTEDFVPFDVNVTTEAPSDPGDLIRSDSADARWGVRVVIGGSSNDWFGSAAGGVAYVGSFNWDTDTPTYVFPAQLGNGNEKYVAEAVSHEAGHTLGLRHDGTSTAAYYNGHGSGETGWASIMGAGYYRNLSQWSKGEYNDADRTEDDLFILTSQNGFDYRLDDYGDTNGTAAAANRVSSVLIDGAGIIETNTDTDVFRFTTGAGLISLDVQEFELGANLDILAQLYDSDGTLIADANPLNLLDAQISATVAAGTYFLHITGTGKGDPLTTGYTDYGSIGQYSFTGDLIDSGQLPSIFISDASATEGDMVAFTLSLSEPTFSDVTVDFATADGTAAGDTDYVHTFGSAVIPAGVESVTIEVSSLADTITEDDETFYLNLSNAFGAQLADPQGIGTIIDDDAPAAPEVTISDAAVAEGKAYTKGRKSGTAQQTTMLFTVSLSGPSTQPITVSYATEDGSASVADSDYIGSSGEITFAAGETVRQIEITVVGDNTSEPDESFVVNLTGATGAVITDGVGVGTIIDDDTGGGRGKGKGKRNGRQNAFAFGDDTSDHTRTSESASPSVLPGRRHESLFRDSFELNAPVTVSDTADLPAVVGSDAVTDVMLNESETRGVIHRGSAAESDDADRSDEERVSDASAFIDIDVLLSEL